MKDGGARAESRERSVWSLHGKLAVGYWGIRLLGELRIVKSQQSTAAHFRPGYACCGNFFGAVHEHNSCTLNELRPNSRFGVMHFMHAECIAAGAWAGRTLGLLMAGVCRVAWSGEGHNR